MIRALLAHGANVNVKCPNKEPVWKRSPLYLAITTDKAVTVHLLLAHGAEAKEPGLVIEAMFQCRRHPDVLEDLQAHGVDVNAYDRTFEDTPLCYAIRSNNVAVLKLLLKCHADVTLRTPNGQRSLALAKRSSPEIIRLLKAAVAKQ